MYIYLYHTNAKQLEIMKTYPVKRYFWNTIYKHYMRALKPSVKMEVYKTWKEWDLDIVGTSDLHLDLILETIGDYTIQGENPNNRMGRLKKSYKPSEHSNLR